MTSGVRSEEASSTMIHFEGGIVWPTTEFIVCMMYFSSSLAGEMHGSELVDCERSSVAPHSFLQEQDRPSGIESNCNGNDQE